MNWAGQTGDSVIQVKLCAHTILLSFPHMPRGGIRARYSFERLKIWQEE